MYSEGSAISSRFHSGREDGAVKSLAERGVDQTIGRAFSKPSSSLYCQVAPHGGDLTQVLRRPVEPTAQTGHSAAAINVCFWAKSDIAIVAAVEFRSEQIVTRILVTGASGFIGRALVAELANAGHSVRAAMRQPADVFPQSVEVIAVSDLTRPVEWRALLSGVKTVVHLAGIAHAGPETAEQAYDRVNRLATAELASAAKALGIGHLIFMSSIRAQSGPASTRTLRETDAPRPTDAYGRSKLAAEDAVRAADVPFTILRPVLIYGPGS